MPSQRLMLLFSMELTAMLAMLLPLTPTDTLTTLTPMVATLTPMVLGTWARGLLMLSQRLMLLFSMAPMAMLAMLLPLIPTDTLPTLTPMVATPTPMVLGTWARGLLMLSQRLMLLFSMELTAMLATPPPTPTDT